jgi:hypothetical protein
MVTRQQLYRCTREHRTKLALFANNRSTKSKNGGRDSSKARAQKEGRRGARRRRQSLRWCHTPVTAPDGISSSFISHNVDRQQRHGQRDGQAPPVTGYAVFDKCHLGTNNDLAAGSKDQTIGKVRIHLFTMEMDRTGRTRTGTHSSHCTRPACVGTGSSGSLRLTCLSLSGVLRLYIQPFTVLQLDALRH